MWVSTGYCCSEWGYCGKGDYYCGQGCQQGPCSTSSNIKLNTDDSVSDIVSDAFFNGIANQAADTCEGKGFYSRDNFLEALKSFSNFGTVGSRNDSKREIAAFFAHVTHETRDMCFINEINGSSGDYCNEDDTENPCAAGKMYFGRGPIQLTWNYNYGPVGVAIGFDGLNDPDIVGRDGVISFKTALWYWMNHCHSLIVSGQGFGSTIRAINPIECDGGNSEAILVGLSITPSIVNNLVS